MPHEEIREENTRAVLSAALQLFSDNGIEGTTFAQVAKRSGVSLRSVYRYFENKDTLVIATIHCAVGKIEDEVRQVVKSENYRMQSGAENVLYLCQTMLHLAKENCRLQVSMNEMESYLTRLRVRDIFSLYNASDNIIIQYFKDAFQKGVLDGTIKGQVAQNEQYFMTLAVVFRGFYNRIATIYSNEELMNYYHPKKLIEDFLHSIYLLICSEQVKGCLMIDKER